MIRSAELLDQGPLPCQGFRRRVSRAVLAGHVHGEEFSAGGPGGDARPAAQQRVTFFVTCERDHHSLPRLPRAGDAVLRAVVLERTVHLVGKPEQREFAQRRQVAETEVVRQARVDPGCRVDVSGGETIEEGLRIDVHDFDLVGGPENLVGDRLRLGHPGDLAHDVVERFDVLDVHRRDRR